MSVNAATFETKVNRPEGWAKSSRLSPSWTSADGVPFHLPVLQRKASCACGGGCPRCVRQQYYPAKTKLTINTPGDQYEQEADRVAEQVMRMPEPLNPLVSGGMGHISTLQRGCSSCEAEPGPDAPEEEVQRQAQADTSQTMPQGDDASAQVVALRGGGEPLPASVRAFFEPRFKQDFGQVRLHTGARAAESARAVDARAYTSGHDIVFGAGEYAPDTPEGRRLLAHELTHVIQQSQPKTTQESALSLSRVLQRQTPGGPTTSTSEAIVTGPNACSFAQHRLIAPAVAQAQRWLNRAISQMDAHLNPRSINPDFAISWPWDVAVLAAMRRHFSATDRATVLQVYQRIVTINNELTTRPDIRVECHGLADTACGSAAAQVMGSNWVFCPSFFAGSGSNVDEWRSETVVHEMAHALVGGPHITDRAYRSDRLYRTLPTAEALTNAESYGLLVQELGTARAQESTAPTDSPQRCPADWQPLLQRAIARAQRWNRNAQVSTAERSSGWLSRWLDLQSTHLGVATAAGSDPAANAALITALNNAKAVYDRVERGLQSAVNFACEARAEGRCTTLAIYWDAAPPSPLHLCPLWRNLTSDDDRIVSLLSGLYGYVGALPDAQQAQRLNYANLAHDLTARFWP